MQRNCPVWQLTDREPQRELPKTLILGVGKAAPGVDPTRTGVALDPLHDGRGAPFLRSIRTDDPHVDDGSGFLLFMWKALDGLDAIDPVVCSLRRSLPHPETENALHRVKRGLDEVVQIPYLVRVPGYGDAELQSHRETGDQWPDTCRRDSCSDCVFPGFSCALE